ncbi:hypothetical protein [Streptomyces hundungensis]|uniref:hypothetical protein n=1 Tax=Streptomyces hundungensis TaxID=1077946 RepID=UPI0033E6840A
MSPTVARPTDNATGRTDRAAWAASHRVVARLATAEGRAEFDAMVAELHEHIAREEDGLFPASLTALSGDEWDRSMAAWRAAHPQG